MTVSTMISIFLTLLITSITAAPVDDGANGQATIDGVDPMTYLYFWGDDLPKGGPPNPFPTTEKRHAAPLSSTQISDERRDLEAEGNLRKRDGDPPAVWLDRSRTLSAPQQLPNAQTRNALFMAARQWLDDIVTADHVDLTTGEISDDYEPARVGADVDMTYVIRVSWVGNGQRWPILSSPNTPNDLPVVHNANDHPANAQVLGRGYTSWMQSRLQGGTANSRDGLSGAVGHANGNYVFAYRVWHTTEGEPEDWQDHPDDTRDQSTRTDWNAPVVQPPPAPPPARAPPPGQNSVTVAAGSNTDVPAVLRTFLCGLLFIAFAIIGAK